MSMFCYQCQEAAHCTACTVKGVCGKEDSTSALQDLLVWSLKGLAIAVRQSEPAEDVRLAQGYFAGQCLFATITNGNFDDQRMLALIREAVTRRNQLLAGNVSETAPSCVTWQPGDDQEMLAQGHLVNIPAMTENVDLRSLRELLIYGVKGLSAYACHAAALGYQDVAIWDFLFEALASTVQNDSDDTALAMVLKAGEFAVITMALLDKANTESYGHPEITEVRLDTGKRPGILISGHDLKDLAELLEQSKDAGIDIYTHSEMLPAHYYPAFKKYSHFHGNYGSSWWNQDKEFSSFNGPILMTTNCITPVKDSYRERIWTTGMSGYPGVRHIEETPDGHKDFSEIIAQAKACAAPVELEQGSIVGGFAHNQVFALADKVVEAVQQGAIKRFVVMAGCDGRHHTRSYFTDVAEELPQDTVILTAGCAKYRYNKLQLGDIGGIPRVLDAGQCNDCYSLAVIAMKLREVFELEDINDLPLSFDIAWYEQKAVTVLLALLHLGFKGMRLGPTLPAFLSPGVAKVLVDTFGIKAIGEVKADIEAMMAGC